MYRPTDRQTALLGGGRQLPGEGQRRLLETWAPLFHRDIYPVLLRSEKGFADLYAEDNGRPNWSVAALLGICILQEWFDLTDQEALDAVSFDARWQMALGLEAHGAYLSRRSLVAFRGRLVARDPEMTRIRAVFRAVSDAAIKGLKVRISHQRLDSTRVVSNIRTRGRVDLFNKTLFHLMRWLDAHHTDTLTLLPAGLLSWYNARKEEEGWEIEGDVTVRAQRLQTLAGWAHEAIRALAARPEICTEEPYQLVVRLFSEHCEVKNESEGGGTSGAGDGEERQGSEATAQERVTVLSKPERPGTSLQSPFDPDAGYSHKGPGYHVQVAETCGNKTEDSKVYQPEIITDYQVHTAGERDFDKAMVVVARLHEAGQAPDVLVVDGGYMLGEVLVEAAAQGIDLLGPATSGSLPEGVIGRERFVFAEESGEVLACPEGHAPVEHTIRATNAGRPQTLHAKFDAAHCKECPLRGKCIARPHSSGKGTFYVDVAPDLRARDANLARQKTSEWRQAYRIRSGIEATNSELKRRHGLGKLRVRRRSRVELAVAFKMIACNAKRWARAVREQAPARG